MADLSDVETALLTLIQIAVYPNGTASPSVVGVNVKIARGWPVSAQLDKDLTAGVCNISVYSPPGMGRNVTKYPRDDQVSAAPVHTLTATVAGSRVTLGGTAATPQNVTVICGRLAFPYAVQAGDTLASIAANVAALIPGASAAGPVVTIPGSLGILQARITSAGTTWTEQRRQDHVIQIGHWCPTPALRDTLVSAVDALFAQTDFIETPDLSACRVRYAGTFESDEAEKVLLFRRDLLFTVEYPTATTATIVETATVGLGSNYQ